MTEELRVTDDADLPTMLTSRALILYEKLFEFFAALISIISVFKPVGICLYNLFKHNLFLSFNLRFILISLKKMRTDRFLIVMNIPNFFGLFLKILSNQAEIQMRNFNKVF